MVYLRGSSVPDTSFDDHGNACSAPSYQWYRTIEVACQNLRRTLVDWRQCNEVLDWGFRNNLVEKVLPNQIARLNRMHREISGVDGLMHVADEIDLIFRYRHYWTVDKMHRAAPSAVWILWLVRDLQRVLPEEGLVDRGTGPLSRVQGRLSSSSTPIARPTRYQPTWVQTIWVRSTSNTGPYGPTPGVLSSEGGQLFEFPYRSRST